jgi:hypothetical protein
MRLTIQSIAILLICVSCSDKDPVSPLPFSSITISVRLHQTTAIPGTNQSIRFDSKPYDGRLPSGVIDSNWWTNTAHTKWTLVPSGAKLHLYVSGEISDSAGVHFDGTPATVEGYTFRIHSLTPLPPSLLVPPPDSELVAMVDVEKSSLPVPADSCGLPMAIGNRWIYLDSSFEADTLIGIRTDTVTIEDEFTDVNGHWWVWSRWQYPFGQTAMVHGDTIFSQEDAYANLPPGTPLYFASLQVTPPIGDSSQYPVIFQGDLLTYRTAVRLHTPIVTPAGSFENGIRYSSDLTYVHDTEVLIPGVGYVFIREDLTFEGPPSQSNRMWLISYNLH